MKIGLIGSGRWAEILANALPSKESLSCVLSSRANPKLGPFVNTKFTSCFREFIKNDYDRIIIANTASKHVETLIRIRDVHPYMKLLLEKPVCIDGKDYEELKNFKSDMNILVDHTLLFDDEFTKIHKDTQKGLLTAVKTIDGSDGPFRQDCTSLWDYGPHSISLALHFGVQSSASLSVKYDNSYKLKSRRGELYILNFKINDSIECNFMIGSGMPMKNRRYSLIFTNKEVIIDITNPVKHTALKNMFNIFLDDSDLNDSRWGLDLSLQVTELLLELSNQVKENPNPH